MRNTLSIPIADDPTTSALADVEWLDSGRSSCHWTETALGRAATGLACAGAMAVATTQLGPAGLPVSCVLAVLAIGWKISSVISAKGRLTSSLARDRPAGRIAAAQAGHHGRGASTVQHRPN